jgi:hypothetical protein
MTKALLLLILGFISAAAAAEIVLHVLPVSTGYDLGAVNSAQPIVHGSSRFAYTYSKDWNFHLANSGTLNNYGFRSSRDYMPDPRSVAMIGNSFVQADAVVPSKTVTERMGSLLDRPAFAVGGDGFSLADYLAAAQWADDTFQSRTLVVLLTTGDLSHSCLPHFGGHYLKQASDGLTLSLIERPQQTTLRAWINRSRLFRYFYDNLRVAANWSKGWQRLDDRGDATPDAPGLAALLGCTDAAYAQTATAFLLKSFHQVEQSYGSRVVFVLAPGYRREQLVAAGQTRDVDVFAQRAAQDGFKLVKLDAAFSAALANGARLDFMPIDGHWNAAAHEIAAQNIAQALN